MLEELRKIKLAELEEKIAMLNQIPESKKYNWFEKIFKKKEYETHLNEQKRIQMIRREQIEELEKQKEEYMYARCIQQLGYDMEVAIKTLREHGKPIIITESDLKETAYKLTKARSYNLDGVIMVHKTKYAPIGDQIKTQKDCNIYANIHEEVAGEKIPMRIQRTRDTIHFALNGEIREHGEGNAWDSYKYQVLIPFRDVPKEKIAKVNANDTYTNGSVNIPENGWILVPKGEGEIVKQNNPNANVIEYDGSTALGFGDKLVGMLGYEPQEIDPGAYSGWRDVESMNLLYENIKKEGFETEIHHTSKEKYQEEFNISGQIINQLIQYVENKPELLRNPQFIAELKEKLKHYIIKAKLYGTPQDLCKDIYGSLLSIGYDLEPELLAKLSVKEEKDPSVERELTEQIIKKLQEKTQISLEQTQGIKK